MPKDTQQSPAKTISKTVLRWFDQHGRKNLPWQQDKTPYRVWISEIMLQQTQVATVIPYFERFMAHFPDIEALANAPEDQVLHLWTGLGYYNRARNLHKTAKIIAEHGIFPNTVTELESLPGIGRSTAGAIVAIAFSKQAAILDGNVKRVLTRLHAITEWPGERKTHDTLWQLAERYTPAQRVADYTQAMMDIGATLCVRGKPQCPACPLQKTCAANLLNIAKELPKKKPSKQIPTRTLTLLVLVKQGKRIFLEKRPNTGVWGGLWSLPEITLTRSAQDIAKICRQRFHLAAKKIQFGEEFRHTFSHFHLDILPAFVHVTPVRGKVMAGEAQIWYNLEQPDAVGLPAPVKKLLLSGIPT